MVPVNNAALLKAVAMHIRLTATEEKYFTGLLEIKRIAAKELLLRTGEVCRHSGFVISGCLRAYTTDSSGDEHIMAFAPAGWWIADMYSLISQLPGVLNIEAMEDSEILLLSKKSQETLYAAVPEFERFFRIITENSLVSFQQRLMDNLSLTAKERYLKFCNTYPGLTHTVPQKQVAAYIGVTPEFLSKMKKNIPR